MDDIPIDAWFPLDKIRIDWLTRLFYNILSTKMPDDEGRKSIVVPIFKKK